MKSRLWNRWLSRLFPQIRVTRPLAERRRRSRVAVELLEDRVVPATFIWDGGGADNKWSTANNWIGNIAPTGNPAALEDLVFTGSVKTTTRNDLPTVAGVSPTFNSITLSANNFVLEGNKVVLGDTLTSTSGNILVGTGVTGGNIKLDVQMGGAAGNRQFFTVNSSAVVTISGKLSGTTGVELTKQGTGVLI